jgi:hypothetical protein
MDFVDFMIIYYYLLLKYIFPNFLWVDIYISFGLETIDLFVAELLDR